MYSPRIYKYRDSQVLYIPTVHIFSSVLLTHTLLVQTHRHDVSTPCEFLRFLGNNKSKPQMKEWGHMTRIENETTNTVL